MSWRIAVNENVDILSGSSSDFVVGRDGTVEQCVQASWSEGPIRVRFCEDDDLAVFLREWAKYRSVDDLSMAWRIRIDGSHVPVYGLVASPQGDGTVE